MSYDESNDDYIFDKIIGFLHHSNSEKTGFLKIYYSDSDGKSNFIEISDEHLILSKINSK